MFAFPNLDCTLCRFALNYPTVRVSGLSLSFLCHTVGSELSVKHSAVQPALQPTQDCSLFFQHTHGLRELGALGPGARTPDKIIFESEEVLVIMDSRVRISALSGTKNHLAANLHPDLLGELTALHASLSKI